MAGEHPSTEQRRDRGAWYAFGLLAIAAGVACSGGEKGAITGDGSATGSSSSGSSGSSSPGGSSGGASSSSGSGAGPGSSGGATGSFSSGGGSTDAATADSASGDATSGGSIEAGAVPDGGVEGSAPPGIVVSLFDGTTLGGWLQSSGTGLGNAPGTWNVNAADGAIHSVGTVRGTLVTQADYGDFRLIYTVKQGPSVDNHYPSVLIWGTRPPPNDAVGGLQFGEPNGYFWDYRPGKAGPGTAYFTQTSAGLGRVNVWNQCEIVTDTATGTVMMACCTPAGTTRCKAKQVLQFKDPAAGKKGPIALQCHSPGCNDEYKDITIEVNPVVKGLITTM